MTDVETETTAQVLREINRTHSVWWSSTT